MTGRFFCVPLHSHLAYYYWETLTSVQVPVLDKVKVLTGGNRTSEPPLEENVLVKGDVMVEEGAMVQTECRSKKDCMGKSGCIGRRPCTDQKEGKR